MQVSRTSFKLVLTGQGGSPVKLPPTTVNACFNKSSLFIKLLVNSVHTDLLADSGAEISVLPQGHESIPVSKPLQPLELQPVAVDGKPLDMIGTVVLPVVINDVSYQITFYVSQSRLAPILGTNVMRWFKTRLPISYVMSYMKRLLY